MQVERAIETEREGEWELGGGRQTENTSNKRINQQQKQKNDLFLLTHKRSVEGASAARDRERGEGRELKYSRLEYDCF